MVFLCATKIVQLIFPEILLKILNTMSPDDMSDFTNIKYFSGSRNRNSLLPPGNPFCPGIIKK